jgi:hypothetical protein
VSPPLAALARTYVFDKAVAEAYIDKQSELTYLPRELAIAISFGELLGGLARSFTDEIAAIEGANRALRPCLCGKYRGWPHCAFANIGNPI